MHRKLMVAKLSLIYDRVLIVYMSLCFELSRMMID